MSVLSVTSEGAGVGSVGVAVGEEAGLKLEILGFAADMPSKFVDSDATKAAIVSGDSKVVVRDAAFTVSLASILIVYATDTVEVSKVRTLRRVLGVILKLIIEVISIFSANARAILKSDSN